MIIRLKSNEGVFYERDGVGLYPTLRNLILSKAETFSIYECIDVIEYIKLEISEAKTLTRKLNMFSLFEMLYYGSRIREEDYLSKIIIKAENKMAKEIADYILSSQIGR